jgi:hypothetical protein
LDSSTGQYLGNRRPVGGTMWRTDTLWFDVAVVMALFAVGGILSTLAPLADATDLLRYCR